MPETDNREEALFQAALSKPSAERTAFLEGACYGDPALRTRIEEKIAGHECPLPQEATVTVKIQSSDFDEAIGKQVGPYKLLEKIGEGGFGVVYVAEQREPVKRRVALKIIKLGMDTRQVVARFEAERQALALMDHPNIAKVLDAGATETGRPYFAMELVRGISITRFCDQEKITTRERIDLFIKICQAIQHAHQKGIIHRDIKPSNILVTLHDGTPVPKVIDFGIAKATQQELTEKTLYTQLQQFIGTPAYMSPEQAEMSGLDIDTRSDIYSLGVLLYELLTGKTPFDADELMRRGVDGMRKAIREEEPVRPSTKVATLEGEERTTTAARQATEAPKLVTMLRGDLDWIVMKCLEKDRTRRYDTANGLAADLKRHLNNEPVVARPPSTAYRFQKAFRRNKLVFTAGAAVAAALVVGIVISVMEAVKTRQAQALTLQSRNDAENLSNFMLDDFYAELEPSGQLETIAALAKRAMAYYDSVPPKLRTADTERNRALAQARLALIQSRQAEVESALTNASETLAALERLQARGDRSEATAYAVALALEAKIWSYATRADAKAMLGTLDQAFKTVRPIAMSKEGSARIKLEYANSLNMPSHFQDAEQGIETCEEALHVLDGIGALDLSNLSAAAAWADIADSEAREAAQIGRLDDAERLEKQVQTLAEGVIARRPSDLHARMDLVYAPDELGSIEARRFHEDAALQLVKQSVLAAREYVRYDPSDATGWFNFGMGWYSVAAIDYRLGRISEAIKEAKDALDAVKEQGTFAGRRPADFVRAAMVRWEAQRGDVTEADQTLSEARRSLADFHAKNSTPATLKEFWAAWMDDVALEVKIASDRDAEIYEAATKEYPRLQETAQRIDQKALLGIVQVLGRRLMSRAAEAALHLGRYAEAEKAARASEFGTNLFGYTYPATRLDDPSDNALADVLLAQAIAGQGRKSEALPIVAKAVGSYRELQAAGAGHVSFRQHFARALYVEALAESSDAEGKARHDEELAEATAVLRSMTEEAGGLHDSKQLMGWITAEQGRTR